jgi:hypothetical protein
VTTASVGEASATVEPFKSLAAGAGALAAPLSGLTSEVSIELDHQLTEKIPKIMTGFR